MDRRVLFLSAIREWLPAPFPLATSIIAGTFSVLLRASLPLLLAVILDVAYPQRRFSIFATSVGLILLMSMLEHTFSVFVDYTTALFSSFLEGRLSTRLFQQINRMNWNESRQWTSADLFQRIAIDSIRAARFVVTAVEHIPLEILKAIVFLILIFWIDYRVAVLVLCLLPIYVVEAALFGRTAEDLQSKLETEETRLQQNIEERLAQLHTIRAFQKEKEETYRFQQFWSRRGLFNRQLKVLQLLSGGVHFGTLQIAKGLVYLLLGYEVVSNRLTVGQGIALLSYLPMFEDPIRQIYLLYVRTQSDWVSLNLIKDILFSPSSANWNSVPTQPETTSLPGNAIWAANLSLEPVLHSLNFCIARQSTFAVVGDSGSGKTSLLYLLLGFHSPSSGTLHIHNKKPIRVVFQDPMLFAGTVRENIAYGLTPSETAPTTTEDEAQENAIRRAVQLAALEDELNRLPGGLEYAITRLGENLPSGLKQRIAIARALVSQPDILIMDDPTSSLDAESDFLIQETLAQIKEQTTLILFTHRLGTIKNFDQIAVMDQGRIVELGAFKELMARKGKFFELHTLQSEGLPEFKRRFDTEIERCNRYRRTDLARTTQSSTSPATHILSLLLLEIRPIDGHNLAAERRESIQLFLKRNLRMMDFVAHYKQNKFIIGLPETTTDGAYALANRLGSLLTNEHTLHIHSISIGVAELTSHPDTEAMLAEVQNSLPRGRKSV